MVADCPEALVYPETYQDPDAAYRIMETLRADNPVCWVEPDGFRPFWLVSRYADIKFVEGNSTTFLAGPRAIGLPIDVENLNESVFGNPAGAKTLAHMDGQYHRQHRALTQAWFLPRNLEKSRDMIESMAIQFVEKMRSKPGECDFAEDIANNYPLRVAMSLLGVPEEDDERILDITRRFFGFQDDEFHSANEDTSAGMVNALGEFFQYFQNVSRERRENPTDDLASVLANAEIDGVPIGDEELSSYYALVATAGHDTTSACICGGLKALVENPDQLAKLRANPDLMTNAVDEIIRYVAPTKHFMRTATKDIELGGQTIREGDSLMLLWASGCRDESVFEDPNKFDIERSNAKNHLALGFGPHMCLGKELARMEIAAFLRAVLARFDNFELCESPEYVKGYFVVGLKHMNIKFTAAA